MTQQNKPFPPQHRRFVGRLLKALTEDAHCMYSGTGSLSKPHDLEKWALSLLTVHEST